MPELPEVEYVARQLRQTLIGRTITAVQVNWARTIGHPDVETFCTQLVDAQVSRIDRRAKLLLVFLSGGQALVVHRRMTGNILLFPAAPEGANWSELPDPYCRVAFLLDDGRRVVFSDPRKFGRISLYTADELRAALGGFGLEPLGEEFTAEALSRLLKKHARQIKPFLLDQTAIAGIGNIYADESLFRAGIHPQRLTDTLTSEEVGRLHEAIRVVLERGIAHGGTTFGRHQDIWGEAGWNREHLLVYQHEDTPCSRCGTTIVRIVVAQRGTHFCPQCQPLAVLASQHVGQAPS
ncbi:MAG TPA: DNA-formamidopyrimidine glycosylase [Ktedonobacterales bacterium]|jgi:formamidopyrimidine-DNA glycosylase